MQRCDCHASFHIGFSEAVSTRQFTIGEPARGFEKPQTIGNTLACPSFPGARATVISVGLTSPAVVSGRASFDTIVAVRGARLAASMYGRSSGDSSIKYLQHMIVSPTGSGFRDSAYSFRAFSMGTLESVVMGFPIPRRCRTHRCDSQCQ